MLSIPYEYVPLSIQKIVTLLMKKGTIDEKENEYK